MKLPYIETYKIRDTYKIKSSDGSDATPTYENPLASPFTRKLKELRVARQLTQAELACEMQVTTLTFSRWERGATEVSISTLAKLAKFFDISLDELYGVTPISLPQQTVRNICENQVLRYAYSTCLGDLKENGDRHTYEPAWQKSAFRRICQELPQRFNILPMKPIEGMATNNSIAVLEEIVKSFTHLSFEMITETPHRPIKVVQMGLARDLSILCATKTSEADFLHKNLRSPAFRDWIDALTEFSGQYGGCCIAGPDFLPSQELLLRARFYYGFAALPGIQGRFLDPEGFAQWILQREPDSAPKIIVCDVGIAQSIKASVSQGMAELPKAIEEFRVNYDFPQPVGIAYSVYDQPWGAFLTDVFHDILRNPLPEDRESLVDTKRRCREQGIEWDDHLTPWMKPNISHKKGRRPL